MAQAMKKLPVFLVAALLVLAMAAPAWAIAPKGEPPGGAEPEGAVENPSPPDSGTDGPPAILLKMHEIVSGSGSTAEKMKALKALQNSDASSPAAPAAAPEKPKAVIIPAPQD